MNHWIVMPVVVPAIAACLLLLGLNREQALERTVALAATAAQFAIAVALVAAATQTPAEAYLLGNWPAPFGIVMVLDRLSAMMLLLTAVLALFVLLYAIGGWDKRGKHFHALFQFQLMGVNGAFLTGDLFNLFVFYEVLLIASYGLMVHGSGGERLKAGTHYVVTNLTASALFLIGATLIYGVTGTLNMADLALKVPQVGAADQGLLQAAALLLLLVFGIKAALVPLHFWLPGTYAASAAPVAALFAIMTKVGAYSILRVYTLAFGADAGEAAWIAGPWLLPAALVTMVLGMVGMLAARQLRWLVAFGVVGSMGTLLTGFSLFTVEALSAGMYYMLHSTFIAAGLFLLVEQISIRRGSDAVAPGAGFAGIGLLSALFMAAAIAMAGLPPLSGFLGKLLILDAARDSQSMGWIWTLILVTSFLSIVAFARAGSLVFWKRGGDVPEAAPQTALGPHPALPLVATIGVLAMTAVLSAFAAPVTGYLDETARQLIAPTDYIAAVLGSDALASR